MSLESATDSIPSEITGKFDAVFGASEEEPKGGATRTRQSSDEDEDKESLASLDEVDVDEDLDGESFEDADEEDADGDKPEKGEEKEREETDNEQDDSEAATVPTMLFQAAKRTGWSDDEIKKFHATNPELAERTFGRMLESLNNITNRYLQFSDKPKPKPKQSRQEEQVASDDDLLDDIYGEKLGEYRKKFGDDYVDEVIKPLVAAIKKPLDEMFGWYESQQREAIRREATDFFRTLPKDMQSIYGNGEAVTDEQIELRTSLAQLADRIRAGAYAQGINLSITDAMHEASLVHASEHIALIERKRLTSQAKTRSRQRINRPTQRTTKHGPGEKSIDAALDAYTRRAAELEVSV